MIINPLFLVCRGSAPFLLSSLAESKGERASKRRRLGKAKGSHLLRLLVVVSFPPPPSPPRRRPLAVQQASVSQPKGTVQSAELERSVFLLIFVFFLKRWWYPLKRAAKISKFLCPKEKKRGGANL